MDVAHVVEIGRLFIMLAESSPNKKIREVVGAIQPDNLLVFSFLFGLYLIGEL